MASKEFRLPAQRTEPPRTRLASGWTLLGIAIAVGATLVLIFPGRGIVTTPGGSTPPGTATTATSTTQKPDEAAVARLESMARKEPHNPELRFTLAQKQTEMGKLAEARAALEPLYNSPDPALRQRARLADFKLQMQQMQALPVDSKERARETERLRQELVAMSQYEWTTAGLLDLADLSNQLQARKLRADIYLRIARSDDKVAREWIDDAAQKAIGDGEYVTAAEIYYTAQERATALEDQRYYFTSAIKAYQAGNMPREAIAAAERHLGRLATDDQTLVVMIGLARAANDMKRAQAYAKRLLRMSGEGALMRWMQAAASFVIPSAVAADREPGGKPTPPLGMRPYDSQNYQLAYETFVATNSLQDAYRVARAAVQQVPNDMRWRERLANVSEWSGRPGEALEHWLFIARRTGNPTAWRAVLRIAPGLANDEALLEAMRYQAGKVALTEAQSRAVAAAYERVGRPREGIEVLEQEYARNPRPALLAAIADLRERSGDVDGAIRAYRRLIELEGPTTDRVTTLATLLIKKGEFREAYDVLERHRAKAPADDAEYLRLLGDLALRLRDDAAAQVAYERLVAHPQANVDDFTRLVMLLQPRQPEAAARLAEAAHQRFNAPHLLLTAIGIHSQRRDLASMRRIFSTMSPATERELSGNAGFLLLRADYRAATGSPLLALADYREALRIDPANRFARMGLMYFLIERKDLDALRREMPEAIARAREDPGFEPVLGSAWLALGDPQRGVQYFAAAAKRKPDDYLLLLNYADSLDQNLQQDQAWRVRRHAWMKIRQEVEKKERPPLELLQSQARIAVQFFPGDAGLAVVRNLLRQDVPPDTISDDPRRRGIEAATRELILAWTIGTEQPMLAKSWMWQQYGRNLAVPAWAEVNVAVALSDLDTLQKALERYAEAVPRYDLHEAARRTQQYRFAQSIAFTALEKMPYDDEGHLRLTTSVFDMVSYSQAGYTSFRRGTVGGHEWTGEVAVWLSPRLRLSFDVSHIDQGLLNTAALASIPANDRLYGVTALWRHSVGETRFTVFHREALADTTGFKLVHQYPLGPRVSGRIGFAHNERTLETSALAAGGMRDQIFVDAQYRLSKREYVIGQLYSNQYYTQDSRTKIGSSYGLNWEAGHRFRTEYPDLHVRAAGSVNHFSLSGTGDAATAALNPQGTIPGASFFLPGSFSVYGVYTGFGTYYQNNYTRALRPFVDVGVMRNTVTGNGYSALVGVSGSVLGADKLTLYASTGRGGTGTNEISREMGLRYMYLFDGF